MTSGKTRETMSDATTTDAATIDAAVAAELAAIRAEIGEIREQIEALIAQYSTPAPDATRRMNGAVPQAQP